MSVRKLAVWLRKQNQENNFAKRISDGTTVYFSDDYAAAYDLRIGGGKESGKTIIIQEDVLLTSGRNLLNFAIEAWVDKMNCELWYLDRDLAWMIIVTKENGQRKYKSSDLIQSKQINFEFRLNQIPMDDILEEA